MDAEPEPIPNQVDQQVAPQSGATDPLSGAVARRLQQGAVEATGQVPEHIQQMKEENPSQVAIMEWVPEKEFTQVDARALGVLVQWIKREFVALLQNGKETDAVFRARMATHPAIVDFADKYPQLFGMLTTREVVLNPRMCAVLTYQVHVLEQVQQGVVTEEQAKGLVAQAALQSLVQQAVSDGKLDPADVPSPPPDV
jgi:hypothetical protein